jgi:hypothetical protein
MLCRSTALLFAALSALLSACDEGSNSPFPDVEAATSADTSSNTATNADTDSNTATSDATGADAAPDADQETCTDGTLVSILRGKVFDADGQPLLAARPQACVTVQSGELICLRPPETNATGLFLQSVPFEAQCMRSLAMRITHPDSARATTYCESTLPTDNDVLAFADPFILHDTAAPLSLPPEGDLGAPRAVSFDAGLDVTFTPNLLRFAFGAYADLRAASISPTADGLCFLDPARPVDALWAFYPEAAVTPGSGGAPLHIPNAQNYPALAAVDLFVLGGLDCNLDNGVHVPEGVFHPYGQAHVSADGQWIDSDPAAGLPCLTWLGYALATP